MVVMRHGYHQYFFVHRNKNLAEKLFQDYYIEHYLVSIKVSQSHYYFLGIVLQLSTIVWRTNFLMQTCCHF